MTHPPGHRRGGDRGRGALHLPGHPLRRRPRAHGAAIRGIEPSCQDRLAWFERAGKLLEAQRLRMRTTYDIEMMRQVGFARASRTTRCIDGRKPGAPNCLLDYFPEDFVSVVDESHVTIPRSAACTKATCRKRNLVEHGFRLPERDGQPAAEVGGVPRPDRPDDLPVRDPGRLRTRKGQGDRRADHPTDRAGRPEVVKPTKGQIDDLIHEIAPAPRRTSGSWSPR